MLHEEMGRTSGQPDGHLLQDRTQVLPLERHDFRHAKYVDNYLVCGHNPTVVDCAAGALKQSLDSHGLDVHEQFGPSRHCTFAGLDFDGERLTVQVSPKRIWKLRFAFDFLLSCQQVSGRSLEAVIGHFTWACLVRREVLCVLDTSYRFVRAHRTQSAPLWASVRKELQWARSLLPMLMASLGRKWSGMVTATDSSTPGFGVCEAFSDPNTCRLIGRTSERWRFRAEDELDSIKATKARDRALAQRDAHDDSPTEVLRDLLSAVQDRPH